MDFPPISTFALIGPVLLSGTFLTAGLRAPLERSAQTDTEDELVVAETAYFIFRAVLSKTRVPGTGFAAAAVLIPEISENPVRKKVKDPDCKLWKNKDLPESATAERVSSKVMMGMAGNKIDRK